MTLRDLAAALDNIPSAVAFYDARRTLRFWNRQFEELFGLDGVLHRGMTFREATEAVAKAARFDKGAREIYIEHRMSLALSTGHGMVRLALADKRYIEIVHRAVPSGGWIESVTDVTLREQAFTDLRAAKKLVEASSRLRSEFLATMSHELRTPLNAIIGFAELLAGQIFGPIGNEKYCEFATDIAASGQHLLELINDIMDVTKLEAGQLELVEDSVDLAAAVRASVRATPVPPHKKGLEIITRIDENLPTVMADERRIKQVLVKIISNAVKFTPTCGRVTVEAAPKPDGTVELKITDTGIGIDHDQIARVFLPFIQADASLSRSREGVGLGLAIAKGLIELHGGKIYLESAPERGTVVCLVLPSERVLADV